MDRAKIHVFDVTNMSCVSCAVTIERTLRARPDVEEADVNYALARATVVGTIPSIEIMEILSRLGYEAVPLAQKLPKSGNDGHVKVLVCALLSLPFLLEMGDMLAPWDFPFPLALQCVLATLIQFYFGAPFYKSAYGALKVKSWNMDVLVVLGTTSAWSLSVQMWLMARSSETYFEASSLIITFVLVGRWLEEKSKRATHQALTTLAHLRPDTARVWRHQSFMVIPANTLVIEDLILVRPGERVPCDGRVEKGESQVDQSLITGENLPVAVGIGADMTGGVLNISSPLHIRVTRLQEDSRLQKIIELVAEAASTKPPIQRLVDQASALFTPIVLGIGVATLGGWILAGASWEEGLLHGITVLVIACPCALGLAAPTAMVVGTGLAASRGILTKRPAVIELFSKASIVIFDKTGTLTYGKPAVVHVEAIGTNQTDLIRQAASLQMDSPHPIAHAVLAYAAAHHIDPVTMDQVVSIAGRGMRGTLQGQEILLGSRQFMRENSIDTFAYHGIFTQLAEEGKTVFWIAKDHELLGFMAVEDQVRPSAAPAVGALQKAGLRVMLLSGDSIAAAQGMGKRLGIPDILADQTPEKKADHIRQLQAQGEKIIMVGDGVNDAPALMLADISIAMGSGTDVARDTASFSLMRDDLMLVPYLINLAQAMGRTIKQNLFWAFFYNSLCIPLAIAGIVTPVFAGAAMALSDMCVIGNALLLRWRVPR